MKNNNKKTYQSPIVDRVKLDNDISLTLDSASFPFGDPESMMLGTETLSSDPAGMELF